MFMTLLLLKAKHSINATREISVAQLLHSIYRNLIVMYKENNGTIQLQWILGIWKHQPIDSDKRMIDFKIGSSGIS